MNEPTTPASCSRQKTSSAARPAEGFEGHTQAQAVRESWQLALLDTRRRLVELAASSGNSDGPAAIGSSVAPLSKSARLSLQTGGASVPQAGRDLSSWFERVESGCPAIVALYRGVFQS